MRVQIVDPPAYTPPYDHALCAALAARGIDVELLTSHFGYGPVPAGEGYTTSERFYRRQLGTPGSTVRRASRLMQQVPNMLSARSHARQADLVHYQWLTVPQLDRRLLAQDRPTVLTAHDVLPREPRPGQLEGQRKLYGAVDAVVVHSQHGRDRLVNEAAIDPVKIEVIPHGAFDYLTRQQDEVPLQAELAAVDRPVVLSFGLIRPYKGIDLLLEAWQQVEGAELWIVGLPKQPMEPLQELAAQTEGVRFVKKFITDPEIPAFFKRADLVALPYREIDQSGVLYTALAFGKPLLLTDVGGFPEIAATGAAELVPPNDADALAAALQRLLADPRAREQLAMASAQAGSASGQFGWPQIAKQTVALYERLLASRA